MTECRYCDEMISYDSGNDIWRAEASGVISCRKNNKKSNSAYRWTHQPWPLKEVKHNETIFFVQNR